MSLSQSADANTPPFAPGSFPYKTPPCDAPGDLKPAKSPLIREVEALAKLKSIQQLRATRRWIRVVIPRPFPSSTPQDEYWEAFLNTMCAGWPSLFTRLDPRNAGSVSAQFIDSVEQPLVFQIEVTNHPDYTVLLRAFSTNKILHRLLEDSV